MEPELRERRQRTWELLVLEGCPEREVVGRLSDAHGISEDTIREDIRNMVEWLPELDYSEDEWAMRESRLRELRVVRQRLHEMAKEAKEEDDLRMELDIYRELIRTLNIDEDLTDKLDRDGSKRRMDELLGDDLPI